MLNALETIADTDSSPVGNPGGLTLSMWLTLLISNNTVDAGITQTDSTVIIHRLA